MKAFGPLLLCLCASLSLGSCYDRYSYYFQKPTFSVSPPPEGESGISLSIDTVDGENLIRYTLDGSAPSSSVGTLYEEPIRLTVETRVRAVSYREGGPAGPVAEYRFIP